ncbi:MAG: radical SAM protein [Candidatus Eremiobacteraeota bacterium]|nr:radical SAM protein [Candidatus Eremiobacteraeota bacterium]
MKIVLIDARDTAYYPPVIAMPLGLCSLAAFLQHHIPECQIVIKEGYQSSADDDADLVGISTVSLFYPQALSIAKNLKLTRPALPVVLGGIHITALPHTLDDAFDIGVIGEGEETFLELVRLFQGTGALPADELGLVKGIAFHHGGKVIITDPRPLIRPLDIIPPPKRDLLEETNRFILQQTSRGCPFRCSFCALVGFNRTYRTFSPGYVVSELEENTRGKSFTELSLVDDLFSADIKRLEAIARMVKERGLHRKMSLGATIRADLVREETLEILKSLHVAKVYIGLESGSDTTLGYLKKSTVTVAQNQRALDLCYGAGILVDGSFIIGAPYEEREDFKATYEFIYHNYKAGKLATVRVAPLTPYPGSAVWEYAASRGLVGEDMDWGALEMSLGSFDPSRFIYLNEKIPRVEFVKFVEIFEDLTSSINRRFLRQIGIEEKYATLDRGRVQRYMEKHS